MNIKAPVITIDGPSGSGKGTIAGILAKRLGWCLLALTFTKFSNTVFTGGVFRRSTFGFFQRIVVRGGTFGAFAWVCS